MITVHIPAQPVGLIQRCARCGEILIDLRAAMSVGGEAAVAWDLGLWQWRGVIQVIQQRRIRMLLRQSRANVMRLFTYINKFE